jgi:hypothetical protein
MSAQKQAIVDFILLALSIMSKPAVVDYNREPAILFGKIQGATFDYK